MKVLENGFSPFQSKGICNSSSFVGGSGSGASSSALTQSILGSVESAGENYALGVATPSLAASTSATPISSPSAVSSLNSSSLTTIIIVLIVALIGFVAFKKL